MRIGILSDIHANVDALVATRRVLDEQKVDQVISLGDVVGYNTFPKETLAMLREMGVAGVSGNHDLMVLGRLPSSDCGPRGRRAIAWTSRVLTGEDRDYLGRLPAGMRCGNHLLFVHSAPGDPVVRLRQNIEFLHMRERLVWRYPGLWICFTGHTHDQHVTEITPAGGVRRLAGERILLDPCSFFFVNPGSVGEPRDSDERAAFAIYDDKSGAVELHRVSYDRTRVLRENARHGLSPAPSHVELIAARVRAFARSMAARVTASA